MANLYYNKVTWKTRGSCAVASANRFLSLCKVSSFIRCQVAAEADQVEIVARTAGVSLDGVAHDFNCEEDTEVTILWYNVDFPERAHYTQYKHGRARELSFPKNPT